MRGVLPNRIRTLLWLQISIGVLLTARIASMVCAQEVLRPWQEAATNRTLQASLLGIENGHLSLRLADGTVRKILLAKLTEADQAVVEAWKKQRSPELQLPPLVWKNEFSAQDIKIRESLPGKEFQTSRYAFSSDEEIAAAAITELAEAAEAVATWADHWPLPMPPKRAPDAKFLALLFRDRAAYEQAGAPPDTAGFFLNNRPTQPNGYLAVPFESLGIQEVRGTYAKGDQFRLKVLTHEILHQQMAPMLPLLPLWMREELSTPASLQASIEAKLQKTGIRLTFPTGP